MDNKKFEELIRLITNEDIEQANAIFHDIVVEKSREIYESMMDEDEMGGAPGGEVGGLMDEVRSDEEGMTEEDDDLEGMDDLGGEEEFDLDPEDSGEEAFGGEEGGEGDIEDRVVDLEDKLDELMAEFEELMAGEEGEAEHAGEFGDEGGDEFGGEEPADEFGGEEDFGGEEEPAMMESTSLQNVKNVTGGDNGVQNKSPALTKPKINASGAKPIQFSGSDEKMPSAPKGPSNVYSKGETQVKGAGSFKNAAGQKTQNLEAAPKPTKSAPAGENDKSIVGGNRRRPARPLARR